MHYYECLLSHDHMDKLKPQKKLILIYSFESTQRCLQVTILILTNLQYEQIYNSFHMAVITLE